MSETEDDLRATAEAIAADARELAAVEDAKAKLDLTDAAVVELSNRSERLADRLTPLAAIEKKLALEIQNSGAD
ncbi:MAG: hypothetical protein H0V73_06375 [Chloroflexi bacterium]|nr:hypothetical protein [Chloroflexota bacterium]